MNTLRDAYKNIIRGFREEEEAKAGASEDLFTEDFLRKNPGSSKEQAMSAYRSILAKPVRGPNPNSAEFKFGSGSSNYRGGGSRGFY